MMDDQSFDSALDDFEDKDEFINHFIDLPTGRKTDPKYWDVEGINPRDYPDFVDAYIGSGQAQDGTPLTDDELDWINENFPEIAQEQAYESF